MTECIQCHQLAVDPADPPRYDVLAETPTGPYCAECWEVTVTARETDTP
ncbi:hypothetical protein SEA_GRETCHEN_18 [Microbacterium phage Gretchen]|uniref:Uncharacterized protein n=1 Tax=Microbacterium phage Percival TaxID=2201439 RepID=A0A2Z4Q6J1_9CAUD|nr:hypothetical protein PBI_PERCIVAL_18 [Microbacterium phage Percival]UDL14792.1 hypothetical protein SEA_GRETCHEN_18 [Microbacterium phage Gretchen]